MSNEVKIVIAQRGWVFVGRYTEDGDKVVLTDARKIRRWGTTAGLGQIAEDGPTNSTALDRAGRVTMHVLAVVATIDCEEDKWLPYL